MSAFSIVETCRVCAAETLSVLDMGQQALTGTFPRPGEVVPSGPMQLRWCPTCSLVQLGADYASDLMYGENYGYRSGLNASMVHHLANVADRIKRQLPADRPVTILDVGSNDGTFLRNFADLASHRIGMDPTAAKFASYYDATAVVVPELFSHASFAANAPGQADAITTISMFYDLPDPVDFAKQVSRCLAPDGIWYLEQSYMPSMLRMNSYDTICHEHIEYYSMDSLSVILSRAGMRIIDVRFNRVNGGSFAVTAAHETSSRRGDESLLEWFRSQERRMAFTTPRPFRDFESRVYQHREDLRALITTLRNAGARIAGLGASTKGNVLLQFCGFGPDDISMIGDLNADKWGRLTPGSGIPIVSEEEARAANPDYFLVLPWHFREGIVEREAEFLARGGGLIFPLPEIELVGA